MTTETFGSNKRAGAFCVVNPGSSRNNLGCNQDLLFSLSLFSLLISSQRDIRYPQSVPSSRNLFIESRVLSIPRSLVLESRPKILNEQRATITCHQHDRKATN